MWRSLCVVVLLPSLIAAQTSTGASQVHSQVLENEPTIQPPTYKHYTYYRQIRRGTTEKAAIELVLNGGFVTSSRSPVDNILPLKLELQSAEGITVKAISYPKPYTRSFAFHQGPIKGTYGASIRLKIKAEKAASLGVHTLKGRLTFQTLTTAGVSGPQQLDVEIPLNVVDRHAKVSKAWPYSELSKGQLVLLIVLSPVLIALVIPMIVICGIGGDIGCD